MNVKFLILNHSLDKIDAELNNPLTEILKAIGGWPVVEGKNWSKDNFNWLDTLIKFRENGFNHDILMDLSVVPDFRDNIKHVIDVNIMLLSYENNDIL